MKNKKRALIVEDQTMFQQLLVGMLRVESNLEVVATAASVSEAKNALDQHEIDLLLLDLSLPDGDGLLILSHALKRQPGIQCIILSGQANQFLCPEKFRKNICSIVDKAQAYAHLQRALQLFNGVGTKQENSPPDPAKSLSKREYEVFLLIGKGYQSKEIAEQLSISPLTVETHRKTIGRKLRSQGIELVRVATIHNQTLLMPPA